jgi:5-oxoprolinase (ATP-hydrolysing)
LNFSFSIDRGGTFTDIYCEIFDPHTGKVESKVMKLLSVDPGNYKDAPTEGIRRLLSEGTGREIPRSEKIPTGQIRSIRMGTTVATNALLERKGDRVALLINQGLKDVLLIGNQSRPKIFDLEIKVNIILFFILSL